jgi:hypothetical protein
MRPEGALITKPGASPPEKPRPRKGSQSSEFLHLGLTAKYQLITALARLRETGTAKRWVRDSLLIHEKNNPSPPA